MVALDIQLNPEMIILARESRGINQRDLAQMMEITPGKLCKVETGEQNLSDQQFAQLLEALNYPAEFFQQFSDAYIPSNLSFRKRLKVPKKVIAPVEAQINIYRLQAQWILGKLKLEKPEIPSIDPRENSIEEIVAQIRREWKLAPGVIESITTVVESQNIPILSFDFGSERVDSRLMLTNNDCPLIFVNKAMLGDRLRFSIAIELGHLIMHAYTSPDFDQKTAHQANLFAAELLMPRDEMLKDFDNDVTVEKLAKLKTKWKVSMHALLYRAEDLGVITYNRKNYLLTQFNQLQIRRREPIELDIPIEKATLMRDIFSKYRTAQKMSVSKLAKSLCTSEEEFLSMY